MKWHFRTLGMGTVNYRKAASRLAHEVESTRLFESSIGHSEHFLKDRASNFWENHRSILKARVPGFGWWIWKPEFIARCLEEIPEGDGVLYLDAGSFVDTSNAAIQDIWKMLVLASEQSVVAAHGQPFIELNYCSVDLMDLMNLTASQRESPQLWAGFLLVVNNPKGRSFVEDWRFLACTNNHEYLIPSKRSQRDNLLIHHMHDQAILSCLAKRKGVASIEIGDRQKNGAVRGIRHRYGYGVDEKRLLIVFLFQFIGFSSKIRLAIEHRIDRDSLSKRPPNHHCSNSS